MEIGNKVKIVNFGQAENVLKTKWRAKHTKKTPNNLLHSDSMYFWFDAHPELIGTEGEITDITPDGFMVNDRFFTQSQLELC
jgi:hypothetical protein